MARALYDAWLNVWDDGDNPGAGSKTVNSDGLNGNWIKLSDAVTAEHSTVGVHAANIIDGPNLKTTAADGVTLELAASPLKLRVKDRGISGMKIMLQNITADLLADYCIASASKIVDSIITGSKLAEATITEGKLGADCVTAAKISHDNTARKLYLTFDSSAITANEYAKHGGVQLSAGLGVPMLRAGSITGFIGVNSSGTEASGTYAYGLYTFAAGDRLAIAGASSPFSAFCVRKNGVILINPLGALDFVCSLILLEIELGD